jgi:hypothetical protein
MRRPGRKLLLRKGKDDKQKRNPAFDTLKINSRIVCWATPKTPNTWNHSAFHITINSKNTICGVPIPNHRANVGKYGNVATDQKNYCKKCIKKINQ